MRVSQSAKFRLDTRAEVLRDLDAKWEVADVMVTIASSKTDHEAALSRSIERGV